MRTHPYIRTAIIGLAIGVVVGLAFYGILRATGTHANWYLLVAIVVAFIPGSIMLSELLESDELDKAETSAEREHAREDAPRS